MDFLNFATRLSRELGVDVPDAEMARVATLAGCVEYLHARLGGGGGAGT